MEKAGVKNALKNREKDPVPIRAIHHIELWVGNAKQASYFYRKAFGFSQKAYSGLETGRRDAASYLLQQGEMRLLLSTPLSSNHPLAHKLSLHGDGVLDIAFHVDDADSAFIESVKRGALPVEEPFDSFDEHGAVRIARIRSYGDTLHSFISYRDYKGPFLPSFRGEPVEERGTGIRFFDHVVGNVELGKMDFWTGYYERALGFSELLHFTDKDISTEYSALMSKVMQNGDGRIKFPINEPAEGRKKSQIEEYLDFYEGPGVQHIALLTDDIIDTVTKLKKNGVQFLDIPANYYDALPKRVGIIEEPFDELKRLNILADRDDEGYLLQIFTKPVQDRPTLFFEVIERRGSRGFGQGNFKALFESIERAQKERGNL